MTIVRDGVEITLTYNELLAAHKEYLLFGDIDAIRGRLNVYIEDAEYDFPEYAERLKEFAKNEDNIRDLAVVIREGLDEDEYGSDWECHFEARLDEFVPAPQWEDEDY